MVHEMKAIVISILVYLALVIAGFSAVKVAGYVSSRSSARAGRSFSPFVNVRPVPQASSKKVFSGGDVSRRGFVFMLK